MVVQIKHLVLLLLLLPPPPSYSIKPPIIFISRSWAAIMFWNLEKEKIAVEFAMEKENRVYLKSPLTLENTGDMVSLLLCIIIHQTHYEKSDWSRAFNQFTIACELDMINAISAADTAFIMSSSKSAWLPSPLECSPQKQNG